MNLDPTAVPKGKIDKLRMLRMISEGASNAEMARTFGVSLPAIGSMKRHMEKQKDQFSPELVESETGGSTLNALSQLKQMNDIIIEELTRCRKFIDREDRDIAKYEDVKKQSERNPDDKALREKLDQMLGPTVNGILKIQGNVISIAAEVRKQVELQLKIAEAVYSVSMMAEFQEEVIEVLRQVAPEVRDEVVKKLKERRQVRGLLKDMSKDRQR